MKHPPMRTWRNHLAETWDTRTNLEGGMGITFYATDVCITLELDERKATELRNRLNDWLGKGTAA